MISDVHIAVRFLYIRDKRSSSASHQISHTAVRSTRLFIVFWEWVAVVGKLWRFGPGKCCHVFDILAMDGDINYVSTPTTCYWPLPIRCAIVRRTSRDRFSRLLRNCLDTTDRYTLVTFYRSNVCRAVMPSYRKLSVRLSVLSSCRLWVTSKVN